MWITSEKEADEKDNGKLCFGKMQQSLTTLDDESYLASYTCDQINKTTS